ncbi:hypothetical protein E4U43_005726 [Claviceps pusilla]|uniref:ribonuclease T1 n=1 Tax=Claviceps pusilla TaxID=123648 RepID=A0A9P7N2K9_9HYPO|nr:hypothetical protein E4U43_005726 [Claviceps pusilla]
MRPSLAFLLPLVLVVAAVRESAVCNTYQYSAAAVSAAVDAACPRVKKSTTVGDNSYPHRYNNYEKFSLKGLSGPFYEFPIMSNGQVYYGGNPGPDRVILTKDCTTAGVLTHQGAANNAFLECRMIPTSSASTVLSDTRSLLAIYLAMMTLVFAA